MCCICMYVCPWELVWLCAFESELPVCVCAYVCECMFLCICVHSCVVYVHALCTWACMRMSVHIHVPVCVCVCAYECVWYMWACASIYLSVCTMHLCMLMCLGEYAPVCKYVNLYMHAYECMCVFAYLCVLGKSKDNPVCCFSGIVLFFFKDTVPPLEELINRARLAGHWAPVFDSPALG